MKTILALFGLFLLLFLLTSRGGYDGYELENFLTARNIVLNHSVQEAPGFFSLPGVANTNDGKAHYTRHGIIQPLLETPFFAVGHLLAGHIKQPQVDSSQSNIGSLDAAELISVSMFNVIAGALIVVFIYLTGLLIFKKRSVSLVAAFIGGCASVIWPYSAIGLETLLTLSFMAAFYFLLRYRTQPTTLPILLAAGIAIAVLINSKNYGIFLSVPLIIYGLVSFKNTDWKKLLWFIAPIVAGLILFIWYNELRFSNPIGENAGGVGSSVSSVLPNITAYLLSFGKSFFVYSPVLLLGLFGLKEFYQQNRGEMLVWLGALLIIIGTVFQYWFIPGDEMWGPRYVVFLTPIFALIAAPVLVGLFKTWFGKAVAVILIVCSVWVQLVGLSFYGNDPLNIAAQSGAKTVDQIVYVPTYSPVYLGSLMLASEITKAYTGSSLTLQTTQTSSYSSSGQEPQLQSSVTLNRQGGLVIMIFRVFNKSLFIPMTILLAGLLVFAAAILALFKRSYFAGN